tara:strand:- start:3436 stop:4287 length:852 start_codon:yes stop_codon:yes gene_type:complete
MRLNHKILIGINKIKPNKKNFFRIINYHNIQKKYLKNFEDQIHFFKDNYNILNPNDMHNFFKRKKINGRNILITFDDGYKSQLDYGINVLEKFNIKSIVFVIDSFLRSKNENFNKKFIQNNIAPEFITASILNKNNKLYEPSILNEQNLNIKDINNLIQMKHVIGYHTKNHTNLATLTDKNKLYNEVIDSMSLLSKELNDYKFEHFAYPFGSSINITKNSYDILKNSYKFIYSGLRGNNYHLSNPILYRDEISPTYNLKLIKAIINGTADRLYAFNKFKFRFY